MGCTCDNEKQIIHLTSGLECVAFRLNLPLAMQIGLPTETCTNLQLQLLLSSWKGKGTRHACLHVLLTLASKLLY